MLKRFKNLFFISLLCLFSTTLYAAKPEIWGYDLSDYPAIKNNSGGLSAYRMHDGDIWFVMSMQDKYLLLKFFKNQKTILNQSQRDALYDLTKRKGKQLLVDPETVSFRDGSTLKRVYNSAPKSCSTPDFVLDYFIKTDPNHKSQKISILGSYPTIKKIENQTSCDFATAPFFNQKLYLLGDVIDLKDDTFIATSENGNLIVRFKKDMSTPFSSKTPFFVTPYDSIAALKTKLINQPTPVYQSVHDALLAMLTREHHHAKK